MRVSELAGVAGVSVRTIRHYHAIGLMPVPPRAGAWRDYGVDDAARLLRIRALADAGYEVIYSGLHQTAEMIAAAAQQESVDAVGLSMMSGAHMTQFPAILDALKARGAHDVVVFGGGIVPDEDAAALKVLGVAAIFTPGTSTQAIVDWIERELRPRVEGAAA